jgi:hypothetical protein
MSDIIIVAVIMAIPGIFSSIVSLISMGRLGRVEHNTNSITQ